jgi:hypothetical protein
VVDDAAFSAQQPKERNLNRLACRSSSVIGAENLKKGCDPEGERDQEFPVSPG